MADEGIVITTVMVRLIAMVHPNPTVHPTAMVHLPVKVHPTVMGLPVRPYHPAVSDLLRCLNRLPPLAPYSVLFLARPESWARHPRQCGDHLHLRALPGPQDP